MTDTLPNPPATNSTASDFATFGSIHLDVTDGERSLRHWRDLIGLELLDRSGPELHLGAGGRELLVLHPGASAPLLRHASGLYHLAFHVPTLADFARIAAYIESTGHHQYLTDHLTHYANYVDDPDGIGLELVFETPERIGRMAWGADGPDITDADGNRHSGQEPIDTAWLFSHIPDGDIRPGMPAGTFVGHLHLRVADTGESMRFYRDTIGFTVNTYAPEAPFFDMSAGGSFPHRLAGNIWESGGKPQRPAETAGMRYFTLAFRSGDDVNAAIERVAATGHPVERNDNGVLVTDPSGTRLLLLGSSVR
jgi:catechol 2,3-dioxygenase